MIIKGLRYPPIVEKFKLSVLFTAQELEDLRLEINAVIIKSRNHNHVAEGCILCTFHQALYHLGDRE